MSEAVNFKDAEFKGKLLAEFDRKLKANEIDAEEHKRAIKRIENHPEIDYWYIEKRCFYDPKYLLRQLDKHNTPYLLKKTTESTEIIVFKKRYIFLHSKNFKSTNLYIFSKVKKDAQAWLETQGNKVILPPKKDVKKYNLDYDDTKGVLVGFDIDHAYWRIAYMKGIISEKTYNQGLQETLKPMRLSSLSVLGRPRRFNPVVNGEKKKTIELRGADKLLMSVYEYIRYTCYMMMSEMAELLKDEFESYSTDCIYFRDTKKNRALVDDYLKRRGFNYKVLDTY